MLRADETLGPGVIPLFELTGGLQHSASPAVTKL